MTSFSATDAAISGFRLVRDHRKAMGVWVLIATLVSAVVAVLTVTLFGAQLEALAAMGQDTATPDPAETLQAMSRLGPAFVFSLVYMVVFYSVLLAAIYRAALRPDDSRNAYLRFGADELRQAGVSVLLTLLLFVAYIVALLVVAIVIGVLAAVAPPAAALVGVILVPAAVCGLIYLAVRLSLANVLTFASGKINVFGSWTLTKGRFWPLFGAYFVATVLALVVYLLLITVVMTLGAALSGGNLANLSELMQSQGTSLESLTNPMGLVSLAVGGLTTVLTSVTLYTPSAAIYRDIAAPAPQAGVLAG